jgi:hypothetical protein
MPTYQIGGVGRADAWQPVPLRSLTCAKCGAALGTVSAVQPHAGMTAAIVCGVCPTARPGVERHEQECHVGTGEGP